LDALIIDRQPDGNLVVADVPPNLHHPVFWEFLESANFQLYLDRAHGYLPDATTFDFPIYSLPVKR
jgi:hypothetical protein